MINSGDTIDIPLEVVIKSIQHCNVGVCCRLQGSVGSAATSGLVALMWNTGSGSLAGVSKSQCPPPI